jgi:hypothetical protein
MENSMVVDVNGLIKRAFGPFHRGDYRILGGGTDGFLERTGRLEAIATPFTMMDPQMGGGVKGLLNNDGSLIVVIEKHRRKAEKYVELYRQRFGKKVRLQTVANFSELFPTHAPVSRTPFPMEIDEV